MLIKKVAATQALIERFFYFLSSLKSERRDLLVQCVLDNVNIPLIGGNGILDLVFLCLPRKSMFVSVRLIILHF